MSTHLRTESAAISTARQSLDNVLSAKAHLEQTANSADKHCALEFQIAELEGMLTEIMDERFARTVDESQPDDETRNVGLLSFIIETANTILASLYPTSNTPPPTYQQNHQPHPRKPKVESRDSSFPLPHAHRNSKRRSAPTAAPPIHSTPPKPTNNARLTGSSKPLPNPFQSSDKSAKDSSIDDLSLSAFQALKTSDAFKSLLDRTESNQTNESDQDNLQSSVKEALGNNMSKELLCAFDVLIRISSFERSSRDATNSGGADPDDPTPRSSHKGKAPLRSTGRTSSPSESSDSDFVTIESSGTAQSPQHTNPASSSQPPPYSQHVLPSTKPQHHHTSTSCVNCGTTSVEGGTELVSGGHLYCRKCAEESTKVITGGDYLSNYFSVQGADKCS